MVANREIVRVRYASSNYSFSIFLRVGRVVVNKRLKNLYNIRNVPVFFCSYFGKQVESIIKLPSEIHRYLCILTTYESLLVSPRKSRIHLQNDNFVVKELENLCGIWPTKNCNIIISREVCLRSRDQ